MTGVHSRPLRAAVRYLPNSRHTKPTKKLGHCLTRLIPSAIGKVCLRHQLALKRSWFASSSEFHHFGQDRGFKPPVTSEVGSVHPSRAVGREKQDGRRNIIRRARTADTVNVAVHAIIPQNFPKLPQNRRLHLVRGLQH